MTDEFKAVQEALGKLPAALQKKVVVGAARAAAKIIADEAKERAPVRSRLLKKSIDVAKAKPKDTPQGHIKFYVVPKSKNYVSGVLQSNGVAFAKIKFQKNAYYAHMVEFGTKNMAARPFLRPAFENSGDKSIKAFQEYALKRTEKEIRKLSV